MSWNTILFDLDGTVTDPKEGITKAVATALRHFGIEEDPDTLTHFIGPPLDESFAEFYGFDGEQTRTAIGKFREYFSRQGWIENVPYPGMAELLRDLRAAGKQLIIATSKPEVFAVRILEHFQLAQYFDHICGAPLDDQQGAKKAAVIRNALSYVEDHSKVVMVGDRRHDVAGAHETGLPAIGVLFGYGDRAEHEAAKADFIAEDISVLRALLLGDRELGLRWLEAFGRDVDPEFIRKHVLAYGNFLWHIFDHADKVPCLEGDAARAAFDAQNFDDALIFYSGYTGPDGVLEVFRSGVIAKISAKELERGIGIRDIYIVDKDFRWTYVTTHEGDLCGPYFCRP